MISEVNAALRDLLKPSLPGRTTVNFTLQADGGQESKGLNLFLYDVCGENTEGTAWTDVRDAVGDLVARKPPVRRFRLSYLVTAWGADAERETELLDLAISALTTWEDAGLANGPGGAEDSRTILGMEVASKGPSGQPWEILKAARVAARPVFNLMVTTSMTNEVLTELGPAPRKLDLSAVTSEGPGPLVAPPPFEWDRDAVEVRKVGTPDESEAAEGKGKGKGKGKTGTPGAEPGEERQVKTWQRVRVEKPANGRRS